MVKYRNGHIYNEEPVVIIMSNTDNNNEPFHIRVRNVQNDSFEYKIEEWEYTDGISTPTEKLAFMVVEPGSHTLFDGVGKIQALKPLSVGGRYSDVSFDTSITAGSNDEPVVFSQTQTDNDPNAVITRMDNRSNSGIRVKLQQEYGEGPASHAPEDVGLIVVNLS